jgi:hypothetical protein
MHPLFPRSQKTYEAIQAIRDCDALISRVMDIPRSMAKKRLKTGLLVS